MNPEAVKQVLESLERNGGAALEGIAANACIRAWGDLILLPVVMLLTAGLIYFAIKCQAKTEAAKCGSDGGWFLGMFLSGVSAVIGCICVVAWILNIPSAIATIKNPQAAAIRILLDK